VVRGKGIESGWNDGWVTGKGRKASESDTTEKKEKIQMTGWENAEKKNNDGEKFEGGGIRKKKGQPKGLVRQPNR